MLHLPAQLKVGEVDEETRLWCGGKPSSVKKGKALPQRWRGWKALGENECYVAKWYGLGFLSFGGHSSVTKAYHTVSKEGSQYNQVRSGSFFSVKVTL